MLTGTITHFNNDKGYGFIQRDDGDNDVFLHAMALKRCGIEVQNIRKGDRLSFDIRETLKRPGRFEAADITIID